MIQAVVIDKDRSDLGMHYTSVPNIKKLIKPLFLDELYEEFEKSKNSVKKLEELNTRIGKMKFLDPACGSGNFLIITYKEIRILEIKILQQIIELKKSVFMVVFSAISLEQFYGIEIDDFAHEVAILSLWLAEHQMNQYFEEQLEGYTEHQSIIPLKKSGTIIQGNATRMNWNEVCPITQKDEVYIIGNPPYLGARYQHIEQKKDIAYLLSDYNNFKRLDYITCWVHKGVEYIESFNGKCAFVTTNSICQGEQVIPIWSKILNGRIEIDFAYRSFKWTNNAKGNAGVIVVIIGLRNLSNKSKFIYNDSFKKKVKNINGYLLEGENIYVHKRIKPLSNLPKITSTNRALDDGNLLLSKQEKEEFINHYPISEKLIKPVVGAAEFLQGKEKYCLWIKDEMLELVKQIPPIIERINKVKEYRVKRGNTLSKNPIEFPHQFLKMKMAKESVLFLPTVSSERREYIQIGLFDNETVIIDPNFAIYEPEPSIFAILSSKMHMVWVKVFSGKLGTSYRYSSTLCYNTFPFPEINTKQKELLKQYVYDVLEARAQYPQKTLAWLYDPNTMPQVLKEAHKELDKAIDKCYTLREFRSDAERLEHLLKRYEEMIKKDTLFAKQKTLRQAQGKKTRKKKVK